VRFVGHGHERIRATHTKTLEFSHDQEITERATCVVAVGARGDRPAAMAGRVRITISAGREQFTLHALANSSWDPTGSAVIRRSGLRLPGTFATDADQAAADLPRELIDAMQLWDQAIEVTVDPLPAERDTIVLFAADPSLPADPRLRAEEDAADEVIAEDAAARRLISHPNRSKQWSRAAPLTGPRRTLVVATSELPGASVLGRLGAAAVEVVGLPGWLSVIAASPSAGPIVIVPDEADPRDLLRRTPIDHRLVITTTTDRLPTLIEFAAGNRGSLGATIVVPHGQPVRIGRGAPPELPGKSPVDVCFDSMSGSAAGGEQLDPPVRAAIEALLTDGTPTKTAANALAALTGWPRRRAYDAVLDLAADPSTSGDGPPAGRRPASGSPRPAP
jgi:hypothetical protein